MESVALDELDRSLVHALQVDGRAPFNRIADVLGVSEHTVARRYRRLRAGGVLRVVGMVDGSRFGYATWTIRLRCTPDAGPSIAAALARRPDTFWVHLLSGGTEISCATQARTAEERDVLLLDKLPRTTRVLGVSAHSVLHGFVVPSGWPGLARLSAAQVARLRPPHRDGPVGDLDEGDHAMLAVLSRDGRAGYAELAAAGGRSESTVRRRLDQLRQAGALTFDLDIPPAALGFPVEARLWISVAPSALATVGAALADHPEVYFAAATTGPTNLMAVVLCGSTRDLYTYLSERVAALDAVHTVETAPVIRTVKRAGAVLPR